MSLRPARERKILDPGAADLLQDHSGIAAAQHAIDTEPPGDPRRLACRVSRKAHHLEIAGGARELDAVLERAEHLGFHAHILEADMAQAEIRDIVEHRETIADRAIARGHHENEVHATPS